METNVKKNCNHCGKYKDEEEFNWRYKALGIRHPTCKECQKPFRKNWYEGDSHERHLQNVKERKHLARNVAREYAYKYLETHPCSQCGETDIRVLEFHHVVGKDMAVAAMVAGGYSIERIQAELDKCIVLCANCHRKLTVEERGWFRGKK
jgi:hypothetical protein